MSLYLHGYALYGILIRHIGFHNVGKRYSVKIVIDYSMKFRPHRISAALMNPLTRFCPAFQAGNRCKITLCQPQNIAHSALTRCFHKTVSAAFSMHTFHKSVFG